jgi:predicted HNH restriction endonuclease
MKSKQCTERANDKTNLITVCTTCHSELESHAIGYQIEELNTSLPEVQPFD